MNITTYSITFYSELCRVKEIVAEVMDFFSDTFSSLTSEDFYDLKLIFSELLINAVIHGNQEDVNKKVTLHITIENKNEIYATIADEGTGFDYHKLYDIHTGDPGCHVDGLFDENGRGICLVCSLTDQISFNENGNEIHFMKKVTTNG